MRFESEDKKKDGKKIQAKPSKQGRPLERMRINLQNVPAFPSPRPLMYGLCKYCSALQWGCSVEVFHPQRHWVSFRTANLSKLVVLLVKFFYHLPFWANSLLFSFAFLSVSKGFQKTRLKQTYWMICYSVIMSWEALLRWNMERHSFFQALK